MNILLLNFNNPFVASGVVTLNLFNKFRLNGHNVKLLTNQFDANYPEGIISMETLHISLLNKLRYKFNILKRKLNLVSDISIDGKYVFFEFQEQRIFYKTKKLLKKTNFKPDVIIILFAKNFINTKNIYEFYEMTHAQMYWIMYDMAPLTGGCHYAFDCIGYQSICGNCPALFSSNPFDITYKNMQNKKYYIDKTNIQLIAASEWQYRQAKMSSLFRDRTIHKILLSEDPSIFRPIDKAKERLEKGIAVNKKVIFFGSIELSPIRKGMTYLVESLKILKDKIKNTKLEHDILLLIAGGGIEGIREDLPFEYIYLGMLDNMHGIASAYQVADIFVCPSIEDSGPTMINQSIMCGTPVVSFEMGVALDLVITGKTGYRAKLKDSYDLAQGLYNVLTLKQNKYIEFSNSCRELAIQLCSPNIQMEAFENIIKKTKKELDEDIL